MPVRREPLLATALPSPTSADATVEPAIAGSVHAPRPGAAWAPLEDLQQATAELHEHDSQ